MRCKAALFISRKKEYTEKVKAAQNEYPGAVKEANMLFYLFSFIALGAAVWAVCAGAAWYLVPAAFIGAFLGMILVLLLFILVAVLFVDKEKPNERAYGFYLWLLTETSALLLKLGRAKVTFRGAEKLPKGRCLIVQNHLSDFDPIALYVALRGKPLFFVSKKENLAIPVGGRLMAGAGVLGLDRENNRQGILVMRKAAQLLTAGHYVCVYPEGTRSKTGRLGPFRDGCFKAAQWGGAPIAVVTVSGSAEAAKKLFRHRSEIVFRVVRVFENTEIAELHTDAISAEVRACMLADLGEEQETAEPENTQTVSE